MNWNASSLPCSLLALVFALSSIAAGNGGELEKPVRIKVSGPVAGKLPDDVTVTIWAAGKNHGYVSLIGEIPILMPWRHFVDLDGTTTVPVGAFVDFENNAHERIMSVLLSRDLFDAPRTIDITLKRPETFVRPASIFGRFGFRYHALISRRMQYSDVPRWDVKTKKFLKPSPPVLRIHDAATGALLQESKMRSMCYGHGWVVHTDFPAELPHATKLKIVVVHDTGDLFGELRAECSFTYKKKLGDGPRDQ